MIGEASPQTKVEQELNTGIVIAGAYADKVRRTLFAQLGSYVRAGRDYATEIARGAAELNMILYYIIVEGLRSDKGDAVRIRIRYAYDAERNVLEWDYGSLKIEFYRKVPDEQVDSICRKTISEKLVEARSRFKPAARFEVEKTQPQIPQVQPIEHVDLSNLISRVEEYGETPTGGLVFVARDNTGRMIGMGSIDYEAGDIYVDTIVIHGESGYRARFRAGRNIEEYRSNLDLLLSEIRSRGFVALNPMDARRLVEEKMRSIK